MARAEIRMRIVRVSHQFTGREKMRERERERTENREVSDGGCDPNRTKQQEKEERIAGFGYLLNNKICLKCEQILLAVQ